MNLTILTDGNNKYGFGHISRSQTLANFLVDNGYKVKVIVLSTVNLEVFSTNDNVIIDIPYNGDFLFKKINSYCKVIGLDYLGEVKLDLVINVFDYKRYEYSNKINGLEYAIIRKDVVHLIHTDSVKEGVLIMLGAYDVNNFANNIIKELDSKGIETTVIEKDKNIDTSIFNHCIHYVNSSNVAKIMKNSLWAVSNGGSSMLELMSLGKAIHVLPQSNAEKALAIQIFKDGGVLGVGDPVEIPDIETINRVGRKAKEMVDGFGTKRILKHIERIFNEK